MQARNNDVSLFLLNFGEYNSTSIGKKYNEDGVQFVEIDTKKAVIYNQDSSLEDVFRDLLRIYNPDVIHIHVFSGINLFSLLAVSCSLEIKKALTLHDHSLFCIRGTMHDGRGVCSMDSFMQCSCSTNQYHAKAKDRSPKEFNLYREELSRRVVNMCDKIICCSDAQKEKLEQLFGKNEKFVTLYYGVGLPKVHKRIKKKSGIATFGFLGNLASLKGIEILEEAVPKLSQHKFRLLMAIHYRDDAPDKNEYLKRLQKCNNIELLHNVEYNELYTRFFSQIDWLIIPSLWEETGPMTLFEAFFYKVPVIISNRKSMVEKIRGNRNSRVFKNTDMLVRIMKGIISRRIRKKMPDSFKAKGIKTYANEIIALYRELLVKEEKTLVLKTGYLCNNNCIFCVTGDNTPREFVNFSFLVKTLEKYRGLYERVTLTGGEPLSRKDILNILEFCYRLGYKITLQTNARQFADKDFCRSIKYLNLDIITHLESYKPKIHDVITRVQGSFYETVSAIVNLRQYCASISVKIMMTSLNYRHIPTTARWLKKLKVDEVWFVYLTPYGHAFTYFDLITPHYSEVKPYIRQAVELLGGNKGPKIAVEGVPFCCVNGGIRKLILDKKQADQYCRCGVYPAASGESRYYCFPEREKQKQKFGRCKLCKFDSICEGVYARYVEKMGEREFNPVF